MHNVTLRKTIAMISLSSHDLNIETGKHRYIERNEQKCTLCVNNDIG